MCSLSGDKIAVLGGGSWGTVLACLAAAGHQKVSVWCRDPLQAEAVMTSRRNERYLPGLEIPSRVAFSTDFPAVVDSAHTVIVALPTTAVRETLSRLGSHVPVTAAVVSASKGLERGSCLRVSQILLQVLGSSFQDRIAAISGPNLAREIAAGKPTGAVVASTAGELASEVQRALSTPRFRLYSSTDAVGVELGGALKNVIAIGAGIVRGLDLGDNSLGSLLTRGLAEMTRLGVSLGARPLTFKGLSGVGDLVATCASPLSRNHAVGHGISQGRSLQEVLDSLGMVAEGIYTTQAVHRFAAEKQIEMPITAAVHRVLFEGMSPRDAVTELMTRDLKSEEEFQ